VADDYLRQCDEAAERALAKRTFQIAPSRAALGARGIHDIRPTDIIALVTGIGTSGRIETAHEARPRCSQIFREDGHRKARYMKTTCADTASRKSDAVRILAVDDNILTVGDGDTNRLVFPLLLERRGHEIVEAHSGQMALEAVSHEDVDLVFMDLTMSRMDGVETARRYRNSTRHLRPSPIIALSARAKQENRNPCLETGMNGLIA
jgi:CheY-like chemotaxis protein